MEQKKQPAEFKFDDKPHVMVVEARYYDDVADHLLTGAKAVLDRAGVSYEVYTVPGALEIPVAILYAVKSLDFDAVRRRFDGYVALGAVIKGATRHDQVVGDVSTQGLQTLALQNTLAIGDGILTVDTMEQALERADPARLDRGGAAAEACLKMVTMKQHFRLIPKRRWVGR
ncbi:MAG TPA: 6,7-dimethyl-8-ribityllumazine synthase [Rhodospirillaceae bacterium]|nr:6,7-dimethyl-8-ribityllumazine synthase [Rhodospirillaceae bacterium]